MLYNSLSYKLNTKLLDCLQNYFSSLQLFTILEREKPDVIKTEPLTCNDRPA